MAILTMRMAAAIVAQGKDGWTFEELKPILDHIGEPYDIRTVATMLGRDIQDKGWIRRIGKRGQKSTFAAENKIFIDNKFQMDLLVEMLPSDVRFHVRKKWDERLDKIEGKPTRRHGPPGPGERVEPRAIQLGNTTLSLSAAFKALISSQQETFSSPVLTEEMRMILPDESIKDNSVNGVVGPLKKRDLVEIVGMDGRRPIMRTTPAFFIKHARQRDLFIKAFPDREEIINDNYYKALNPNVVEEEEVPAADAAPSSGDDVAGEPEIDNSTREPDQESQPSSPPTHDEIMEQHDLVDDHSQDTLHLSAVGLFPETGLPATYIVGKCIVDYLSMVSVDPLPNPLGPFQSAVKPPESESDGKGKLTDEQKHEIKHVIAQKDEKIAEQTRRIMELTNHAQSSSNQCKRVNHRLEEALRELAHYKRLHSEKVVELEKLKRSRSRPGAGSSTGFTMTEVARVTGKVPEGNGVTVIRKHG